MATAPENYYVVIIAGGVGTRLWPKSRKKLPKQFFHLDGSKSLVRLSYERLEGFLPPQRVFITAPATYKDLIAQEVPQIPEDNYILEPQKKGTTAANAISAMIIKQLDPQAVIHFVVADDYLTDFPRYHQMSLSAFKAASQGGVVVFGVKPRYPNPGLGHVKISQKLSQEEGVEIYQAEGFVEKPDEATARRYFDSGSYFVHGSGFCSLAKTLLDVLRQDPQNGAIITQLDKAISAGSDLSNQPIAELYSQLVDVPIEYSLLEKAQPLTLITLQDSWNDVGSWQQVYDIFPKDRQDNVFIGNSQNIIARESFHNIIFADKRLIAVTNLRNMVVIDTDDSVLVCPMADAQHVKKLVEILEEKKLDQYL